MHANLHFGATPALPDTAPSLTMPRVQVLSASARPSTTQKHEKEDQSSCGHQQPQCASDVPARPRLTSKAHFRRSEARLHVRLRPEIADSHVRLALRSPIISCLRLGQVYCSFSLWRDAGTSERACRACRSASAFAAEPAPPNAFGICGSTN